MRQSFIKQRGDANARTKQLFVLFGLAIALTLVAYNAVVYLCFYIFNSPLVSRGVKTVAQTDLTAQTPLIVQVMIWFSIIYSLILFGIYFYHYRQLKNEPQTVIYTLDNCRELSKARNHKERQLINITEEMSVAAGQAVPRLFLLENNIGINAFTYGFADKGYSICVTKGALDYLNRAELQALLAHEFGHIVSDDVGINMRLSSILQSFFVISEVKEKLLSASDAGWHIGSSGRGAVAIGVIYLFYYISLVMVGVGKRLQAFISRTREVHADACAVQFTRQQDSLVSLLQKIYALQQFAHLENSALPQNFQHIQFYGNRKAHTHPPLAERIKAYGGQTDLSYIESIYYQLKQSVEKEQQAQTEQQTAAQKQSTQQTFERLLTTPILLPIISGLLNTPNKYDYSNLQLREGLEYLTAILITIENLEVDEVKAHCDTLYLDLEHVSSIQTQLRQKSHPIHWIARCQAIAKQFSQQSKHEKQLILDFLNKLVKVDNKISVHEFSYLLVINQGLQGDKASNNNIGGDKTISDLTADITAIVYYLATLNSEQPPKAVYNYLCERFFGAGHINYEENQGLKQSQLYQHILAVKSLNKKEAVNLLTTLTDTILGDNQLNIAQYNLLFALATQLGLKLNLKI